MAREPISSEEIEQAKSYLIGNFPLEIERFELVRGTSPRSRPMSGGDECWNNYYDQVTLVDAGTRLSRPPRSIFFSRLIIVIAGDKNLLADQLAEFDSIDVYDNKGQFNTP